MPPPRALVAALPLLVALALVPTLPTASADAVPAAAAPVLGSPAHLAPIGRGWGRVEPMRIDNGGDPSGKVVELRWEKWGTARARGYGLTYLLRPEGGYYDRPGRIALRASGLGSCPDGTAAYTHLDFRVAARPGEPAGRRWRPWSGTGDIC